MSSVITQFITAAAAIVLSGVGLWFAHSYRRQLRIKLSDQVFQAYASLWEITGQFRMSRAETADAEERRMIAAAMEDWYFTGGNGLLLPAPTRRLFYRVLHNLEGEPLEQILPESLRRRVLDLSDPERNLSLSCACHRYISLLRTQLKDDLRVYDRTSSHDRRLPDERQLLLSCGISPGPPASASHLSGIPCFCGTCVGHVKERFAK